ncbi:natriuretic peptides A-like [Sceloporus undulatus]|uniref:natriuretic peptides A-like n=1 Tax=Sceloporus undulatus TaxID=8520 RepID=UPI001C4AB91F|nr:natriuretic peptides A-like [Sceloporus undulatus]
MEAKKGSFFILFSLLLGFRGSAAHPLHSLSPAKELASMEALLQRLEEKISLMEELQDNPGSEGPKAQRGDESEFSDEDGEDDFNNQHPQLEPRFSSMPSVTSLGRTSLLKRMGGLQVARRMRESGCFGGRLDRIGSVSGMGCKGSRRN